jgi:hypothetical protein
VSIAILITFKQYVTFVEGNNTISVTPWTIVLLERLIVTQLVKKLPAFCGIQTFITMFTRVPGLSWMNPIHTLTDFSLRSILILYYFFPVVSSLQVLKCQYCKHQFY